MLSEMMKCLGELVFLMYFMTILPDPRLTLIWSLGSMNTLCSLEPLEMSWLSPISCDEANVSGKLMTDAAISCMMHGRVEASFG